MSSCKINNKLKYVIHDNYNRPFIVYILGNNVMIYKQPASEKNGSRIKFRC